MQTSQMLSPYVLPPPHGIGGDNLAASGVVGSAAREAREDPNAFLEHCLPGPTGRAVTQALVHRELQEFLSKHAKAVVELPRDHGKTTQLCGRVLWELGRNPGLRVKVVCGTAGLAADRCRYLRDAVARNPRVREVFPELLPGTPWAVEGFTIARPAAVVGPSVAAFGVAAGSTGTRADLLVCDDVAGVSAVHSRADRDRVSTFVFENLLNLLEPDGRFWGLFTPWHADDVNARLVKNPAFAHFRRAVGANLEPVWPEKWPAEKLAARRQEIGAAAFARGYRLTPIAADEVPIRPGWVKFFDAEPAAPDRVILSIDPAVSAKPKADASAVVALALCGNAVYSLAADAHRVTTPELVYRIAAANQRWNPDAIVFESNAAFAGVKDLLVRHAAFGPKVIGVTQTRQKAARVAGFAVAVENGTFRLRAGEGQRELFHEMTTFPFAEHDDLLDAAATGTAFLLGGNRPMRVWV